MFEIIKIKAVEKKVTHHGWVTRKFFQNKNFESVWTLDSFAKDMY